MTNQTWLDSEPSAGAALRQGAALLAAGLRRGWLTLACTLVLVACIAAAVTLRKREYAPRFVLRVVEGDRDPSSMPRPPAELREYVQQAVFTSQPLFELMRRHGLYPKLMRSNPRAALESFREDISVDVYRNYFMEQRAPGALPRSARLAVSYHAKDRALSLAVTRELGELIEQHELALRREQAQHAADAAAETRNLARYTLEQRSQRVLAKQAELRAARVPDPELEVELVGLLGSLPALEQRAQDATRRAAALDLGAGYERRGMGLRFELVDDPALPSDRERHLLDLALAGGAFVLGLPLLTMAVGAFAPERGRA